MSVLLFLWFSFCELCLVITLSSDRNCMVDKDNVL